jgi:hypothetical protein
MLHTAVACAQLRLFSALSLVLKKQRSNPRESLEKCVRLMTSASVKSIYGRHDFKTVMILDEKQVFVKRYCQVLSKIA